MRVTRIVIIGGGPAGYEAALVAVELGAQVTLIDRDGLGGACVLTDCVPSKALIATSDKVGLLAAAPEIGVQAGGLQVDFVAMNRRIRELAQQQSLDIGARLTARRRHRAAGIRALRRRPTRTDPSDRVPRRRPGR